MDTELNQLLEQASQLKAEMAAYRPLSEAAVAQLEKNIRIEHVWSSNAIEGNTLNRYETASILDTGMTIHNVPIKDVLETLDLNAAYEYMTTLATEHVPLSTTIIRDLNRIVTLKTANDVSEAGTYRTIDVWPYGSEHRPYTSPLDIRPAVDALIAWANQAQAVQHPIMYAADLHQRFVTIHPFLDGNGRTARLLMNMALTQAGYPVINVQPDKSARQAYMTALEASQGTQGTRLVFEKLITRYTIAELKRRIQTLALNEQNQKDAANDISSELRKLLDQNNSDQTN